ncbi:MAG: nucleoside diphosphate kinase regulator [Deltaproteobacteria bacterium]|nr:nucleoside diphosphate kinase regulator [Deltaproteobacteria bacterium]
MSKPRDIYVTRQDFDRLSHLLEFHGSGRDRYAGLEEELGRAKVVDAAAIPPDVVTMNSRVRFQDESTGEELEITLVYPKDAAVDQGRVSVLAPVGSALLGLSVGQSIEWPMPANRSRRLRVAAVTYQPEASGDSDL